MNTFRDRLTRKPWIAAVAILVVIAIWVASGAPSRSKAPEAQAGVSSPPAALPEVRVVELAAQPVARTVTLTGNTAPARRIEIKAETTGRVTNIGAARGARIARGTLIVRLDDGDRMARLSEARAIVRQRELEYEGQMRLKPQGYISDTVLAQSAAQLESARAELARAEIDLARMEVRAPFDGALQDRDVEIGDYVSPGTTLATFVDDRTLVVAASLPESQGKVVRSGLAGTARLATGEAVRGTVRYIAPVANEMTRTFKVELEIPNAARLLPVGVTAQIDLPVGQVMAHRVSPALLTLDDGGVVGIKILDDSGHVGFVPAVIARSSADGVWITGLPDPAKVITIGQGYVRTGQLVRVSDPPAREEALAALKD